MNLEFKLQRTIDPDSKPCLKMKLTWIDSDIEILSQNPEKHDKEFNYITKGN